MDREQGHSPAQSAGEEVLERGQSPDDAGASFHVDPEVPESKETDRIEGNAAESSAFHVIEEVEIGMNFLCTSACL